MYSKNWPPKYRKVDDPHGRSEQPGGEWAEVEGVGGDDGAAAAETTQVEGTISCTRCCC